MCFSMARLLSTRSRQSPCCSCPGRSRRGLPARAERASRAKRVVGAPLRSRACRRLRIDDRSTCSDRLDGGHELRGVTHVLLEQVCAPSRACLEQLQHVPRFRVLAEDDHTDLGIESAVGGRELDALVGVRTAASGCRSLPRPVGGPSTARRSDGMSSHEATTSMLSWAARSCCIPSRTKTLSSARATRIGIREPIAQLERTSPLRVRPQRRHPEQRRLCRHRAVLARVAR